MDLPKPAKGFCCKSLPRIWLGPSSSKSFSARAMRVSGKAISKRCSKASNRSEEHTSELQSLMRISYAVFCLKKKKKMQQPYKHIEQDTYKLVITRRLSHTI